MLRNCLANIDAESWTHLVSAITHGVIFVFLLVFPKKVFDDCNRCHLEKVIDFKRTVYVV